MRGVIRSRYKCAYCGGSFEEKRIGRELDLYCSCGQRPRTYYIYIHWKGDHKIVQDSAGHQLKSFTQANRLLERIRSEIDANTFEISEYKVRTKRQYGLRQLIRKWYKGKVKKPLAPTTLKDYRCYIRKYFSPSAQKQKLTDCRNLRTHHITDFFDSLPASLSEKSKKNIMVALKNFMDWLISQGYIDRSIIFTYPEIDVPEPKKIWSKKATALLALPFVPEHDRPVISFLLRHPLRSGEACALLREDFNLEEGFIHIHQARSLNVVRHRKNKKGYLLAISENFDTSFLKKKFPKHLAFTNSLGNMYSSNHLKKIWKKACESAGIEYIPLKYSGRTTLATEALNNGAPIEHVAGALGDSIEVTKKHYAHLNWKSTKKVIDGNQN